MKLIAQVLVYNEGDYLEAAIRPWLDVCERIDIFEGAFITTTNLGYPPRSTDKTIEIARKLEAENPYKIKLVQHNEYNEPILRNNHLYQTVRDFGRDDTVLFILDGDEVYSPEDVKRCIEQVESEKHINRWWISMKNYISQSEYYLGFRVPRFARLEKAVGFESYNGIAYADGTREADILDVCPSHYSWHPLGKAKRKIEWQRSLGWECSFKIENEKIALNEDYYLKNGKSKPIILNE